LKARPQFLAVAAARRKCALPGLVLQARPQPAGEATPGTVRVGFTATRKIGNAVARNRAKRRLRAAADAVLPARAAPGFDLVLIARAGTAGRPFAALCGDLARGLDTLGAAR